MSALEHSCAWTFEGLTEAEVSAMDDGYAASIFLFDALSETRVVQGSERNALMSMKTDSAIALKQLNG